MLELDALAGDAIDVRGLVAHQAIGIRADVGDTDVVAKDHKDVGLAAAWRGRRLLSLGLLRRAPCGKAPDRGQRGSREQQPPATGGAFLGLAFVTHDGLLT